MTTIPDRVAAITDNFTGRTWLLPLVLDWYQGSGDRLLIVKGKPGSGKSALMGWLAGAGPLPTDSDARSQLLAVREQVKAAHFCMAESGNTAPKVFAQNMSGQLAATVSGFKQALETTLQDRVQIHGEVQVGTAQPGSTAIGVCINFAGLSDELAFNNAFRAPLQQLYAAGYTEPMILLVDALDEARLYTGPIDLVELLTRITDLPRQVRLIVTTRDDASVLYQFPGLKPVDLITAAPPQQDDVRSYTFERLSREKAKSRRVLADRIGDAAKGVFLYARLVLDELLRDGHPVLDPESLPLPAALSELYQRFLNREVGTSRRRWFEEFEPLLGLLAVVQGNGMGRTEISRIISRDLRVTLETCRQYLQGDWPNGPFRLFHRSFVDYLVSPDNEAYRIDPIQQHARIVTYYLTSFKDDWSRCDPYGMAHLCYHAHSVGKESGDFAQLHKIFESGFLQAKQATAASTSEIAPDWDLIIDGCRIDGDFVRLLRYGFDRSGLWDRLAFLHSSNLVGFTAQLLLRSDDIAGLERLIADLCMLDNELDRLDSTITCFASMVAFGRDQERADRMKREIESRIDRLSPGFGRETMVLGLTLTLCCGGRDEWVRDALRWSQELTDPGNRGRALIALADAHARIGASESTLQRLQEVLDLASTLHGDPDIVDVLKSTVTRERSLSPNEIRDGLLHNVISSCHLVAASDRGALIDRAFDIVPPQETECALLCLAAMRYHDIGALDSALALAGLATERFVPTSDGSAAGALDSNDPFAWLIDQGTVVNAPNRMAVSWLWHHVGQEARARSIMDALIGELQQVVSRSDITPAVMALSPFCASSWDWEYLASVLSRIESVLDHAATPVSASASKVALARAWQKYGNAAECERLLRAASPWQLGDWIQTGYPEELEFLLSVVDTALSLVPNIADRRLTDELWQWVPQLVRNVLSPRQREGVLIQLAAVAVQLDDNEKAKCLIEQARELSGLKADPDAKRPTELARLANAYLRLSDPEAAEALADHALSLLGERYSGLPALEAKQALAALYLRISKGDLADAIYGETLAAIAEIRGDNFKSALLRAMASGWRDRSSVPEESIVRQAIDAGASIRLGDQAVRALRSIAESAVVDAMPHLADPMLSAVEACCGLGSNDNDIDSVSSDLVALLLALSVGETSQRAKDMLRSLTQRLLKANLDRDYPLASSCEAVPSLANAWIRLNQRELAWELLSRSEDRAARIESPEDAARAWTGLTLGAMHLEDLERVGSYIGRALAALDRLSADELEQPLGRLVAGLAETGEAQVGEAWSSRIRLYIDRVASEQARSRIYASLAACFAAQQPRCMRLAQLAGTDEALLQLVVQVLGNQALMPSQIRGYALFFLASASRRPPYVFVPVACLALEALLGHGALSEEDARVALRLVEDGLQRTWTFQGAGEMAMRVSSFMEDLED